MPREPSPCVPLRFVDPWGLFAELLMDDLGVDGGGARHSTPVTIIRGVSANTFSSGVVTGLVDPFRNIASTVSFVLDNNPKTTVYTIRQGISYDPVGFAIDTLYFNPLNPWTHVRSVYRAHQAEGRYGVGRVVGAHITTSAIVVASYGVSKGVEYVVNKGTVTQNTGWRVGDPIDNLTAAGNQPSWSTVRARYWKNQAHYNPGGFSPEDLDRARRGLAPLDSFGISMELHHPFGRGGSNFFNFHEVTRAQHNIIHSRRW